MKDIELVIKIPEEIYEIAKRNQWKWPADDVYDAIKNGTPLDKIRAEIAEYGSIMVSYAITKDTKTDKGIEKLVNGVLKQAKEQVLEIIDKYKAESEE